MATITMDYYGMSGTGKTVKEAKADAGAKVSAALRGSYTPIILTHRGYAVLVARSPQGWDYRTIYSPQDGIAEGRVWLGSNYETEEDATRSALNHLAQMGWAPGDGTNAPEFVKDKAARGEFSRWAEFQTRYARAKAAGLNDNEAHHYGCDALYRFPNAAELLAKVEGEAVAV